MNFYGKSAHAARRELGVDAIKMANEAYFAIENMIAEKNKSGVNVLFHVGKIEGGKTNNVVADECSMFATLRNFSDEESDFISCEIREICDSIAREYGGKFEFVKVKFYPVVKNDKRSTEAARAACADVVGEENVLEWERDMVGEDFSYYTNIVAGCFLRLGVRNEALGITAPLHNDRFNRAESALAIGSDVFVRLIMNKSEQMKAAIDEDKKTT